MRRACATAAGSRCACSAFRRLRRPEQAARIDLERSRSALSAVPGLGSQPWLHAVCSIRRSRAQPGTGAVPRDAWPAQACRQRKACVSRKACRSACKVPLTCRDAARLAARWRPTVAQGRGPAPGASSWTSCTRRMRCAARAPRRRCWRCARPTRCSRSGAAQTVDFAPAHACCAKRLAVPGAVERRCAIARKSGHGQKGKKDDDAIAAAVRAARLRRCARGAVARTRH